MGKIQVRGRLVTDPRVRKEVCAGFAGMVSSFHPVAPTGWTDPGTVVMKVIGTELTLLQERFLVSGCRDDAPLLAAGMTAPQIAWVQEHQRPITALALRCPQKAWVSGVLLPGQRFGRGAVLFEYAPLGSLIGEITLPDAVARHLAFGNPAVMTPVHWGAGALDLAAHVAHIDAPPGMHESERVLLALNRPVTEVPPGAEIRVAISVPALPFDFEEKDRYPQTVSSSAGGLLPPRGAHRPAEVRRAEAERLKAEKAARPIPPDLDPSRPVAPKETAPFSPTTRTRAAHGAKKGQWPDGAKKLTLTEHQWTSARLRTVPVVKRRLVDEIATSAWSVAEPDRSRVPANPLIAGQDFPSQANGAARFLSFQLKQEDYARLGPSPLPFRVWLGGRQAEFEAEPLSVRRELGRVTFMVRIPELAVEVPADRMIGAAIRMHRPRSEILAVPSSAVAICEGATWALLHAGKGAIILTPVVTGRSSGGYTEVRQGLKAGQPVCFDFGESADAIYRVVTGSAAAERAALSIRMRAGSSRRL